MTAACHQCKFWNCLLTVIGECRRHAPSSGGWHQTRDFDWCGDFVNRCAAVEEKPTERALPLGPAKNWYENPRELEQRTIGLCKPLQNGVWVMATLFSGNVVVHDDVTSMGFMVTREEFIDGVYLKVIPERWAELMRQRIADGTVATDKPTM